MRYELIATATFGLEAVVRREIESLDYKVLKTEAGKVTFEGDERAIVRSNLWLRRLIEFCLRWQSLRQGLLRSSFNRQRP